MVRDDLVGKFILLCLWNTLEHHLIVLLRFIYFQDSLLPPVEIKANKLKASPAKVFLLWMCVIWRRNIPAWNSARKMCLKIPHFLPKLNWSVTQSWHWGTTNRAARCIFPCKLHENLPFFLLHGVRKKSMTLSVNLPQKVLLSVASLAFIIGLHHYCSSSSGKMNFIIVFNRTTCC